MNEAIMTIYTADCRENAMNTLYPHKVTITCADDLAKAAAYDHVCAEYAGNRRSNSAYRGHCLRTGDYTRSAADFKRAVEVDSDLTFRKSKDGMYCYGLRIREDDPFPQPLTA